METLCKIRDLYRAIAEFETRFEKAHHLCLNEGMLLCCLSRKKRLSSGEIAEQLGLSNSNTSKVIRSVEDKGYIERNLGDCDKRQMYFSLTEAQSRMEHYLDSLGLVNVGRMDPTLKIDLMYTRADNFTGKVLYEDLQEAYLHPEAAKALLQAQKRLKELYPGYSLIIYDAARPMSVQQKMWNVVKGTSQNIYVSNPARGGGLHNYGLAVDVSIADEKGNPLPMGTKVDHLGKEAHIDTEAAMVQQGIITAQERKNRLLLRRVMTDAGYKPLRSEWWHFNFRSREEAKRNYKVIR